MNHDIILLIESFFDNIEDDIFTDTVDSTLKLIDNMNQGIYIKSSYNIVNLFNTKYKFNIIPDKLTFINYDISSLNVLRYMFCVNSCMYIKELYLYIDTSHIKLMNYMFNYCTNVEIIDVSTFNTFNVTNMDNMFADCKKLKELDLSNFNIANVVTMNRMFYNCQLLLKLDLSNFDISNVKHYKYMFAYCIYLEYIKCKLLFKEWCYKNYKLLGFTKLNLELITWDIVDN